MVANVHQRIVPVKADFTMDTDRLEALIQVRPAVLPPACSPVRADDDEDGVASLARATTAGGPRGRPAAVLCRWHDRHHQQRRGRRPHSHRADRWVLWGSERTECPVAGESAHIVRAAFLAACRICSGGARSVVPCGRGVGGQRVHLPRVPPAAKGPRVRHLLRLQHAQVAPDQL